MEKGREFSGEAGEGVRVSLSMLLVQLFQTGMAVLSKLALDQGMRVFPFLVYRNAIGALCVACFAVVLERKQVRKLCWKGSMWIFMNAFLVTCDFSRSLTSGMSLYYYGLRDTTAAYSSIFLNLVPIATFIFSLILRTEKLGLGRPAGIVKVLGTLICVGGAMIISLYKGKAVHRSRETSLHDFPQGTFFLAASCVCYACWFILQHILGTALTCVAGCLQSFVIGAFVNRKRSEWVVRTRLQLATVIYSGLLNVAATFMLVTWAVSKRGPTFPPMFTPLSLIFVTIVESLFMGLEITIGSILGMLLIIAGIYAFLWGKAKETAELPRLPPSHGVGAASAGLVPAAIPDPPLKPRDLPIRGP
ncbi:unnamed protein product [Spirodela intermedia]|uniref:WAT1-related protein n=1 Tax=Spirodela intermedia TaxID=51605 RepID=A0A7I8IF54_SPIIN|nr:unnamed protein product [Spirodela intermedia]CAA6656430.1 unnamed protein product [Spirodela intermedia]